ncbi:MAG: hypothetical protein L0H93_13275 [Nocardioides sp.]|nr:hypothetical protein [Nocardioides sp.]
MPRYLIPFLLVIAVALTGCDNGNQGGAEDSGAAGVDSDASTTPSEAGSAPEGPDAGDDESSGSTSSPPPDPGPTTAPVTSDAFCKGIRPIITGEGGEERGEVAMDLLSDGLPTNMPENARSGLQVLVDLSPYFSDTTELFRSYYALGDADKTSVHAFAGYVMSECGKNLVKDLMPKLPQDLISELPSDLSSLLPAG